MTKRNSNGRALNPVLPEEIAGISFLDCTRRAKKSAEHYITKFPCPYRRQHGVSRDAAAVARLDRLFAKQRATLHKQTGEPYFVDIEQDEESAQLLRWAEAHGFTC